MTDTEKLALFDWIQDHEASDGVITRRLAWANEAEKVLKYVRAVLARETPCQLPSACLAAMNEAAWRIDELTLPTPPPCMGRAIVEARKA